MVTLYNGAHGAGGRYRFVAPQADTCDVVLEAGMDSDCGVFGDLNFFTLHLTEVGS